MRSNRYSAAAAALALAIATPALAADGPLVIAGARVVTISGAVLENTSIIIQNGRISSVGSGLTAPAGARIIDGKGKTVYPGLFDGLTYLGLAEVTQGAPGTVDMNETGDINPHAKTWVALHPDSELLPVARAFVITTALSAPGSAQGGQSLIAGQSAVIRTVVLVDRIDETGKRTETWSYEVSDNAWKHHDSATLPFACGMNYNMEFDPDHDLLWLVTGGDGSPTRVWALRLSQN